MVLRFPQIRPICSAASTQLPVRTLQDFQSAASQAAISLLFSKVSKPTAAPDLVLSPRSFRTPEPRHQGEKKKRNQDMRAPTTSSPLIRSVSAHHLSAGRTLTLPPPPWAVWEKVTSDHSCISAEIRRFVSLSQSLQFRRITGFGSLSLISVIPTTMSRGRKGTPRV